MWNKELSTGFIERRARLVVEIKMGFSCFKGTLCATDTEEEGVECPGEFRVELCIN